MKVCRAVAARTYVLLDTALRDVFVDCERFRELELQIVLILQPHGYISKDAACETRANAKACTVGDRSPLLRSQ